MTNERPCTLDQIATEWATKLVAAYDPAVESRDSAAVDRYRRRTLETLRGDFTRSAMRAYFRRNDIAGTFDQDDCEELARMIWERVLERSPHAEQHDSVITEALLQ